MFENLAPMPADPILGLSLEYASCEHPKKVNLGVGVYQNDAGVTPIFKAVKQAEQELIDAQQTKAYIAQQGDSDFLTGMQKLVFGDQTDAIQDRSTIVMTPGGCGGLRVASELVHLAKAGATVWVSDPTWGNHYPLVESAGLQTKQYPYYDMATGGINFDAMLATLETVPAGDLVLLHACCHNPTGADLTKEQWQQVIDVAERQGFIPWFDIAYQGFGESLDDDAYSIRLAASKLPEIIVVSSCSKNFGLYRERVGAAIFVTQNAEQAQAALSNAVTIMRRSYTMTSYHGGGIVGRILHSNELTQMWVEELEQICAHIQRLRSTFSEALNAKQSHKDFSFIADANQGMFSFLGIAKEDVLKLRSEYGIYILNSTRINVAGLSDSTMDYVTDSIATVLNG